MPPSTVIKSAGFTIQGGAAGPAMPQVFQLYTVPGISNARIDTVNMTIEWNNEPDGTVLAVQLVDPNGNVIDEQSAPMLLAPDEAQLESRLSWSRQGNDTGQLAAQEFLYSQDNVRRMWANMPLPDVVLAPLSAVNLLVWMSDGGEGQDTQVDGPTLTSTPTTDTAATTTALDILPLVVPQSNG